MSDQIADLLADLAARDIRLRAADGQLAYDAPPGVFTSALKQRVAALRSGLLTYFAQPAPVPLFRGQERMWFLSRLEGSAAYTEHLVYEIHGPLDRVALARAIGLICARHAVLRTRFREGEAGPEQVIMAEGPGLAIVELGEGAEAALAERLGAAAGRAFDLGVEAPVRFTLFGLGPVRHVLSVAAHHAAWDGWSNAIFATELGLCYRACRDGEEPVLPALANDVAALARAGRQRLAEGSLTPALEKLRRSCEGFPTLLALPLDRPRGLVADGAGAVLPVRIDPALAAALTQAGRRASATPYMVLLAAWALLLARLSGRRRLLIGAPVAGRQGPDEEALIGYFSNTVVFAIDLEGARDFADLVSRTRDAVLAGMAGQEIPFELLVEALAPPRSTATTPLVQSVFALQPAPIAPPAIEGATVSVLPEDSAAARYELMLNLAPAADGGFEGILVYATALFDRGTVVDWLRRFEDTLRAAPESWNAPLDWSLPATQGPSSAVPLPVPSPAPSQPLRAGEQRLADIWREFLPVAAIAPEDDFFLLGGHSLMLMRVLHRIEQLGFGRIALKDALRRTRLQAMALLLRGTEAGEEAPASLLQEGLWLARRDDPDTATSWVVALCLPLPAPPQRPATPEAVQRALDRLADRHPALRTTIFVRDGQVMQRIAQPGPVALDIHRALDPSARGERMRLEMARPIDLERGPLYRFHLFENGGDDTLFVVADHIVTDGWSEGILSRDFQAFLAGETGEAEPVLPALATAPARLAVETRNALAGAEGTTLRAYWLETLQGMMLGAPPASFGRRPPDAARRGRRVRSVLVPEACAALDHIAKMSEVTPTTVLVAVVGALIARLKNDGGDLCIATPFACRSRAGHADLVGCFAGVLPLRFKGALDISFTDHLTAARDRIGQALIHQDYPLGLLAQDFLHAGDGNGGPLFDAVVVLDTAGSDMLDWFGPTIATGKYDLAFIFGRLPDGGATLSVEYDEWLYGEADAEALAARLGVLLCDAAARPRAALGELALLPEAERRLVVETFNQTSAPYARDLDLAALWRDAALRFADNVALAGTDGFTLTYAELDRRADRLAAILAGLSQGEPTVALSVDRGVEAVVVILAVLKMGAAYLPIDGKLPSALAGQLMADAGARLILADAAAAERLAGLAEADDVTLVRLDLIEEVYGAADFTSRPVDGGAPAYIMFTSGSTGAPKGVVVPHRAVARLALDHERLPIGPEDVIPQLAPLGFDAATFEIWGALLNGARLALIEDEDLMEPVAFGRALERVRASVLWLTAGLFNRSADENPAAFARLRLLVTGGETLSPAHVRHVLSACPDLRLLNAYGPTENTTFTTLHPVTPADLDDAVPIGRPIANSRVLILDERLSPVPVGVWGELACAGDGVALGYANRPDLTASSFVTLPWGAGERVYRTGDIARWRHDGVLEFGGRRDGQVKIRGHRIETAAIESALRDLPDIRDVAVLATGEGVEKLLVACLAAADPAAEPVWRRHLAERLPSYMMPARFLPMPELPVTANGKTDRRALQRLIIASPVAIPAVAITGNTAQERLVMRLFAEFFPSATLDGSSDFLRLGGHSLLVMRLADRIAEETGRRLTMRVLFGAPTVVQIAALLPEAIEPERSGTVPLAKAGEDYPLSPGQERLVILQRLFPDSGVYNVPITLDLEGPLDGAALDRAFVALESHHHALRLRIVDDGGALRQRLATPGALTPRHIDLRRESDPVAAAAVHCQTEITAPFRLEAEAGARAVVLRLADRRWRVLLVVHHALCDGWSVGLLLRDLAAFYAAETGVAAPPPSPARQFEDFAAWQQALVAGPEGRALLERVAARLTPPPPPLDLPGDRRRPTARSFRGGVATHIFDASRSGGFDALAQDAAVTPFALATALIQVALHRLTGERDLATGTLVASREQPEFRDTVGFFVNTLVLRQTIDGAMPFRRHLAETQAACLQAIADQYCPFESVVAAAGAARDLSRNPLFDVLVVWQDAPASVPQLQGLAVSIPPFDFPLAKFDLGFHFTRHEGRIVCQIEFSADLFDVATIERLGRQLDMLADAVLTDPNRPIEALDILPADERALVLERFNDTKIDLDIERTIPAPFLDRMAADPVLPALLRDGGPTLDYRGFARRAGAVARRLTDAGIRPGDVVALCIPRSPEMLIAIHAILLSGAAYAPLGPEQPAGRIRDMLDDLGRPLVLATAETRVLVEAGARDVILLAEGEEEEASDGPPPCLAAPDGLAYVLFTSGSTGRPKGVEIEHRAVLNRILWMQRAFPIGPGDVVLQKTPVTFDVSVWELFWWSWTGAAVAVPPPGLERDPQALAAFIERHRISVIHFVPSMLAAFLACLEDGRVDGRRLARLRLVFASGEALDPGLVERFDRLLHRPNGTELHNLYGPTEATVDVAWHPCSPWRGSETVPIGRPIANTRLYVLDGAGRPQPVGVSGEIHIGGVQVARGYRNRPDLTRERFVADPFVAGGRLYRTGDLGRWRADGTIDYLGRLDDQVKVRGQRIEPGEIEHALESDPAVERAAVVPAANQGLTELHAYVLPRGAELDLASLIAHLAQRLPEAMIPARFFRLDTLPLTASGKLDRKALRGTSLAPLPAAVSQPVTNFDAVQSEIRAIWQGLLPGVEPGPRDGFFSVGGNSLLVIRLHQKIEARWPGIFNIADLFACATIADQARRVAAAVPVPVPVSITTVPAARAENATAIAIVGLAVRLPGSETLDAFWRDVAAGADHVRPLPAAREGEVRRILAALGVPAPDRFREGAYLDDVMGFEPRRFRMSPADAALVDPEQRLFLDVSLRALENAGRGGSALDDAKVGVFVGGAGTGLWRQALMRGLPADRIEQAFALNVSSNVATRLSFLHNWRGPAALVDTACSASLTAVHFACRALRAGECDWALVGGAKTILLPPGEGQRLTIDSSTGRTRAFSADADGTGMGEGAVALVLRPLDAALADRDPIHAVILGSAVNQDGASSGMAAPNPVAQAEVIRAAAADAGLSLASLSYVEAHGTGTRLGDPIEIAGLTRAFAPDTAETGFALIGAGKGNYGHLDGAAGVLGLARAVQCLVHDQAPPQPFFTTPNPGIAFDRSPVAVARQGQALPDRGGPRRAGVSAFGLSGVNAHVVLQAAPSRAPAAASGDWVVVVLSAPDPEALRHYADAMVSALRARPDWGLEEIARTLVEGRDALPARLAMVVRDRGDLMARLAVYAIAPDRIGDLTMAGLGDSSSSGSPAIAAAGLGESAALAAAAHFIAGGGLVWPDERGDVGRAHLPSAPLVRRSLLPDFPPAAVTVAARPWLGSAARTAEGRFQALDIHAADFWPVAEHRLDGEPTLVGMAFPVLLAAVSDHPPLLRDMRWLRPVQPGGLARGSVTLAIAADGAAKLIGRTLGGDWQTFAEARLSAAEETIPALDLAAIAARCAAPMPASPLAADGPVTVSGRWNCLERIAEGDGERLAWGRSMGNAGLPADPALLDVMASLALDSAGYIPVGCAEFHLLGVLPAEVVAHVRSRTIPDGVEADIFIADAADGRVAVACRGLRFMRRTASRVPVPSEALDILPALPVWRAKPNDASAPGRSVLLLGEGPLAERLAARLAGRLAGRSGTAVIDGEAIAAATARAEVDIMLVPGGGPDLPERVVGAVRAVLGRLVRPTRLLGLAQGAFAVEVDTARDPIHAVTFGVVTTAGLEEPLLTARYVDTDDETPEDALLAELAAEEEPFRAIAWRGGKRLARFFTPIEGTAEEIVWPDSGVCVVTGGSGGLSLLLAPSLAAGGRVALALLSRRGVPQGEDAEAVLRRAELAALAASGLRIEHYVCDVTDRGSLADTLDQVRRTQGPITAVVHNAGVSDGGFLMSRSRDGARATASFAQELAAKLDGTRLLDELTRDDPLKAFVMAGSLTGLLGTAGFAAYVAGNAFEDGFASFRRRQGRPGLTIDWCRIDEVGMAARRLVGTPKEAALGRADIAAMWRRVLGAGGPQVALLDSQVRAPLMGGPDLRAAEKPRKAAPRGGSLETALAQVWAEVLGYDDVAPEDDFYALGGDSIAGMQIVERIVRDLGHPLTLADLLEGGTVSKLAERLREKSRANTLSRRGVASAPQAANYPVAWEQLAVLNAEAVAEMGTAYNLPHCLPLPTDLDPARLAAALEALIERHEILRTRFIAASGEDAEPLMEVLPAGPAAVEFLTATDEAEAGRSMNGWVRPFALFDTVAVRFARLDVAGQSSRLLLDVHHALADAFSLEVLLGDLAALLAGRAVPRRELQFKDYAWWSRKGEGASSDDAARAYWLQRFATLPPVLDLPADRSRPARPSRHIDTVEFAVPYQTIARLRAAAAARRATPFALVTAAWSLLLQRYARVSDLVVAVPVDSRETEGLAGMLGMMVSLVPLRLTAVAGESVADVIDRVQATCSQALRHRSFGLGRLLAELALPAVPGRAPLADVTLSYMNFAAADGEGDLLPFGLPRTEGKSDLGIFVRDLPDRMIVACEYATDLFDRERIERMGRHFRTLLAALVEASPEQLADRLPLIDSEEAAAIAAAGQGPIPLVTYERGLFGSFVDRARARPGAPALTGPDGAFTYGELLRRASGVAAALAAAGIAPGDHVALHVERDARAIVLLLGIAAAGAVYMPLDPAYPAERIAWLLEDGACRLAIADAAGRAVLEGRIPLLAAETLGEEGTDEVPEPPAEGPVYLMYTSGSTGRPKGVVVPQRAVLRLALGDEMVRIGPTDRVMQTGPLAFDASTYEIWGTLLNGAELCVATRDELLDPVALGAAFARHQASVAWLTNGLFNRQADAAPESFAGLRAVVTGGETMSLPHLRRAMEGNDQVVFFNAYGPTENTTFSTLHRIRPEDLAAGPMPIGQPITHTRVVILEASGVPAPIGVWGEIAVGGLGLADGYFGRPDLTAEKFVDDPTSPGERIYRSGDLGRWRADGAIEFGGRIDMQVKVRGFRIELEEIELALTAHEGVAEAALLLGTGADGGELVACFRPAAEPPPQPDSLRAWLGQRLPAYMVPRRFVAVAELPITANGKVDRAKLAALLPADEGAALGEPIRPGAERIVADILSGLFNRRVEDRTIGFLALGGHSLLAIRVVNRIAEATGVRLAMRDFFAADSVVALAALVEGASGAETPILPVGPAEHYPASNAQARLYLAHRLDSESGAYNIAFALPAGPAFDGAAFAEALRRLAESHEPLRTGLFDLEGDIRQRIEAEAMPPVAVSDLSGSADPRAEALRLVRREAATPFELERPPLLRARTIKLGTEGWLVILVLHHIVGDGWSSRILLRELARHYDDAVAGRITPPPVRSIAYRDFAVWQAGRDWRAAESYWHRTLEGAPDAIALPTDRPPAVLRSHRGDTVTRALRPEVARGLADYARGCDTTLAVVGLALFAGLLYRLSRQRDLLIGLGVAGRDRAELEGLIGFFVNVLPIRLALDDDTAFEALVMQARSALMGAMDHRDYPFDLLVRAVAPKRQGNRQPLVNVVFEYQRFEDLGADLAVAENPALGETALDPGFLGEVESAIRPATAKHDLLLFLTERRDRTEFLLEFDTDVIDRGTAERWLSYLDQFASWVVGQQIRKAGE